MGVVNGGPPPGARGAFAQLQATLTPEQQAAQQQMRQASKALMVQAESTLSPEQKALKDSIREEMRAAKQAGTGPTESVRQKMAQFRASLTPDQQQVFAAAKQQAKALHEQFDNTVLTAEQRQLEQQIRASFQQLNPFRTNLTI